MHGYIGLYQLHTLFLVSILHTAIFLLLFCAHMVTPASKSNSSKLGPSDSRQISKSRFTVLRRFLGLVLIIFIVENPLSQLAAEIGRVRMILVAERYNGTDKKMNHR